MSERRKAQRFALTTPLDAQLHLVQDVIVVRSDANGLTILSPTSSVVGDEFALRLRGNGETMAMVPVRTVASDTVVVGNSVQYRIELRVLPSAVEGSAARATESV